MTSAPALSRTRKEYLCIIDELSHSVETAKKVIDVALEAFPDAPSPTATNQGIAQSQPLHDSSSADSAAEHTYVQIFCDEPLFDDTNNAVFGDS